MKRRDGAAEVLTLSDRVREIEQRRATTRRGTYRYDEASDSIVFVPTQAKTPQVPPPTEVSEPRLYIGRYL